MQTQTRLIHVFRPRIGAVAYVVLWVSWGVLAYLASTRAMLPGDLAITLWVQSFRSTQMDAFMRGISALGDSASVIGEVTVIAGAFWLAGKRQFSLLVVLTPVIVGAGDALQWAIGRPRPLATLIAQLTDLGIGSFPSGHAVWAAALVTCLFFIGVPRSYPRLRVVLWTILLAFLLLTGLSRIYLGAHWLSDVIGGYGFGALSAIGLLVLYRRWLESRLRKGGTSAK